MSVDYIYHTSIIPSENAECSIARKLKYLLLRTLIKKEKMFLRTAREKSPASFDVQILYNAANADQNTYKNENKSMFTFTYNIKVL